MLNADGWATRVLRVCAGTIKLKGEHWQKEPSFCAEARRNSEEAAAAKAAMKEEGTDVSGSRSITCLVPFWSLVNYRCKMSV
jgi:hypothetical protein